MAMPRVESRLRYLEHIEGRGVDLFRVACGCDLEGIVGKWKRGSYSSDGRSTSWMKIKNPAYSQIEGRHELFETSRQTPTQCASGIGSRTPMRRGLYPTSAWRCGSLLCSSKKRFRSAFSGAF